MNANTKNVTDGTDAAAAAETTMAAAAPTAAELSVKLDELESLLSSADGIIQLLQANKPHMNSPYIAAMRSKSTSLLEMAERHAKWADAKASAAAPKGTPGTPAPVVAFN